MPVSSTNITVCLLRPMVTVSRPSQPISRRISSKDGLLSRMRSVPSVRMRRCCLVIGTLSFCRHIRFQDEHSDVPSHAFTLRAILGSTPAHITKVLDFRACSHEH